MSDARTSAWARALSAIADAEGVLGRVDAEFAAVAAAYESNEQLRSTLGDQAIPAERRQAVVEQLLAGKGAHPVTAQLLGLVIGAGRARDLAAIASAIGQDAASSQGRAVAEVRSAVALSEDQQRRLGDALAKAVGTPVNIRVIVDPSVVGGLVATVGDTVIDGTVRTNLDRVKARLS
ncbi:MAG: synthase subunit delta [Actinomycetota bacterium]|jgi:F-type H+-transporting ATPase subunit delta